MFVKGDIRARRVNGWNLTELETDTLKTTTTQQVCGRKVFLNEVKLGHLKMMESRRQPNRLAETLPTRLRLRPELPDGKSIEFYGRVNFSHGLTITGKLHTAAKLTSEGASSCQWDECLILKGLQMQLSEMATALDSFHSIRSESGSFANVRMEVVQSENFVHVILGFADCKTQLRAYIWNPIQERFFLKGNKIQSFSRHCY